MKVHLVFASLFSLQGLASGATTAPRADLAQRWSADLTSSLSRGGLISFTAPPRWSSFEAPRPALVVNAETEEDVATTVKYCAENNIPFLAQNGGNGWATNFDLGRTGVLINLARLNQVTFNAAKTQATIGGGSNINNTIAHANAAGALITTGNCNCVGTLGAILGGGYGNLMGVYSFGVDNVLSLRVVTADGRLRTVTPSSDPDLFWGLRGAGPNLGIVTSAVVKSYPVPEAERKAWTGPLIYSPDKLEAVVQAIQDLDLKPEMNVFMYFVSGGPPSNEPVILLTPFLYKGTPETGRAAFASLFNIGPLVDNTAVLPYNQWNTGGDGFCVRGARKPAYTVGHQTMIPSVWRDVWNKYVEFQKKPGAENSVVIMEAYSLDKARSVSPNSAAFPHRNVNFNSVVIPWYTDSSLDRQALSFACAARSSLRSKDGLTQDASYVNFAHGDEPLSSIYGSSLARLKTLKQRVDPKNRFDQWFNIQ